jgi:hypothetical protein
MAARSACHDRRSRSSAPAAWHVVPTIGNDRLFRRAALTMSTTLNNGQAAKPAFIASIYGPLA